MLELSECFPVQFDGRFTARVELDGGPRAQVVHRDIRRDREHPGAQVLPVLQPVVRSQGTQERLLPRILRPPAEQPSQVAENLVPVGEVEALERRIGSPVRMVPIIDGNVAGCEIVRCAVVGHVEWVEFALVPQVPRPADRPRRRDEVGAGGRRLGLGAPLARLAGSCELFTALGGDELGRASERRLAGLGIDVHVQWGGETRRAWTHVDSEGERTITVLGEKLLPHGPLPLDGYDLVFFVAGDAAALR